MSKAWSAQQSAIFSWFATGRGNLVVRARAGTGKTTTIIEAVGRAPERNVLLAAFNKRIADELTGRITADNAQAKTLHSVGFSAIRRHWSKCRVNVDRGADLARNVCGQDAPDPMVGFVRKVAALGKGIAPVSALSEELTEIRDARNQPVAAGVVALQRIADDFDCVPDDEWEEEGWDTLRIAQLAQRAMQAALHKSGAGDGGEIDFDDMIYLPVALNWVRPSFDMVVVDEAQDMNAAQILLAQRSCRGRVAVVGDDRQAIYGFRGADSTSIDRLLRSLKAAELPLTITYRCPQRIVDRAARIVPDYQAAPNAPEGVISRAGLNAIPRLCQPGDFVLSRKNAPLAGVCLAILREGKRARIEGKDIGKHLLSIVRRLKAKSMPDLLKRLEKWLEKEKTRALKSSKHPDEKIAKVTDEAETIAGLADGLSGPRELEARIDSLFADTEGSAHQVVCSSVHRSKGLEAERVFLLEFTLYPGKRMEIEERNIEYVAITRARHELVIVSQ